MQGQSSFLQTAEIKTIIFDGAMGTNLFTYNLTAEDYGGEQYEGCPEVLNLTRPDVVQEIHRKFFEAGADVVETNTFGASKLVLAEYGLQDRAYEISKVAAGLAREVADQMTTATQKRFIAGSIGPGTKLATLGNVSFDELKNSYKPQIRGLLDGGADLLLIETCQDPLQIKACLNACFEVFTEIENETASLSDAELLARYPAAVLLSSTRESCSGKLSQGLLKRLRFPIQVQVTIEQMGTMLVGSDIASALTTLSVYPIDAVGMNCATGPKEMLENIQFLTRESPFRVSCLPNAGIPENIGGHAHFPLGPEEFSDALSKFVKDYGVDIVGGCCGTTYEHIRQLAAKVSALKPGHRDRVMPLETMESVSSLYSSVPLLMEPRPLIVGERTNANGSKLFRDLLAKEDYEAMTELAKEQVAEGAHILDLCVAYVGRNELRDMEEMVRRINTAVNIPLMIDSTEAPVLEAALKLVSGKAVINSVNLEDGEERVELIAKLCKKYGAALVVLTIDEQGMAKGAEQKFVVAERLYKLLVDKHGLAPWDLIYDTLTFTLGSGEEEMRRAGIETIESIKMIKAKYPHVKTILGVSNISFGLDQRLRPALNSVFLYEAVKAGLDMAIVNNKKIVPMNKIDPKLRKLCEDLVYDRRVFQSNDCVYDPLIDLLACVEEIKLDTQSSKNQYEGLEIEQILSQRIIDGNKNNIEKDLDLALNKGHEALDIINKFLMNGMKVVGDKFGAGEMQLPFVLQSATAMKAAVAYLEQFMEKSGQGHSKGSIVLATVKGDVHDIGKNLVDIILSNNGYKVYNLGIKQPIEDIIKAIEEYKPSVVGLSGLLVKSTLIMKQNLESLNERGCSLPVILGGAALTRRFVEEDCASVYKGTVFYGFDAFTDLHLMEKICKGENLELIKQEFYKTKRQSKAEVYEEITDSDSDQESRSLNFTEKLSAVRVLNKPEIPVMPLYGNKFIKSQEIDLDEVWAYLNTDALIIGQWRMGKGTQSQEAYQTQLQENIYPTLERVKNSARKNKWLRPQIAYGYYPCRVNAGNPNQLDIYNEGRSAVIESFTFPRQMNGENLCLTDYFRLNDAESFNTVAFQIVTVGAEAAEHVQSLYKSGDFSEYLYDYGLAVESTEALAEYAHARIRKELGFAAEDDPDPKKLIKCHYHGMRYSFGYPACPRLEDQAQLFRLLKPEVLGLKLSEEWQIDPEHSTSAIIVHHPDAKYYKV